MNDTQKLREALIEVLPAETSIHGETPSPSKLYLPPAHIKALRLEANLVIGARGVGKSFWTKALASDSSRALLGLSVVELEKTVVRKGFDAVPSIDNYPNEDSFAHLINGGAEPYDIWRAVILRALAQDLGKTIPASSWNDSINWMKQNPEDAARILEQAQNFYQQNNRFWLIVFDALDRTSADWRIMDTIVRGLLRAALWLKATPRLHAKIFLREDQYDRTVTDFTDASKLLATRAELSWARHDLHGLLWQHLLNGSGKHGNQLRALYEGITRNSLVQREQVYMLVEEAKRETSLQKALFEKLAGPWMGRDRRRGIPYTWAVGHLADARGQTSPRSFLAAVRQAATDSLERYPEHTYPLHYESIKRGIQKASEIRVNEVAEDYPWVRTFLEKLRGRNVPCGYEEILTIWQDSFPDGPASAATSDRLPAQHSERGWDGIREDFIRLGLLEMKKDGRIDMPDLYRVGFGLGRKGGVKPGQGRNV